MSCLLVVIGVCAAGRAGRPGRAGPAVGGAVGDVGAPRGGVHRLRGLRGVGAGPGVALPERAFGGGVQQRQVVVGFQSPPRGERATVLRRAGPFVGFPQRLQAQRDLRVRPPLPAPHGVRGVPDVERHHPPGDELLNRLELRVRTQLLLRLGRCGVIVGDVSLERGVLRIHGRRVGGAVAVGGRWGAHLVVQAHRPVTTGMAPPTRPGQHRTTSHMASLSCAHRQPRSVTRVLIGSKSAEVRSGSKS